MNHFADFAEHRLARLNFSAYTLVRNFFPDFVRDSASLSVIALINVFTFVAMCCSEVSFVFSNFVG